MSAQQSAKSPLPDVRRVVTGHKPTGKSTIIVDQIQQPQYWSPGSLNAVYDIGRNDQVPAKLDSELTQGKWVDEVADSGHVSKTGAVFRSFDYAPGSVVVGAPSQFAALSGAEIVGYSRSTVQSLSITAS
jgi:hypothetical protein